jgi:hypothetical protein
MDWEGSGRLLFEDTIHRKVSGNLLNITPPGPESICGPLEYKAKHQVIVNLYSLILHATNMLTCSVVSSRPQDRADAEMLHFLIGSLALKHEAFFTGRVVSITCTCLK